VRAPAHLSYEALLLHLAAELAQSLFELLRVFDDYFQTLITPSLVLCSGTRPVLDNRPGLRAQE